jgi:signal transduction histidine kinase
MHFFKDRKGNLSSAIRVRNRTILTFLQGLYTEAGKDLNANVGDINTQLTITEILSTTEMSGETRTKVDRFFVHHLTASLSARFNSSTMEVFLLPASQIGLVPQSEYPSRLRYRLEWNEAGQDSSWLLDGQTPGENDIRLVILASLNDLMSFAEKMEGKSPRLKIGDLSLTTGLRNLMMEKTQLVSQLFSQQEALQAGVARELHDSVLAELHFLEREIGSGRPYTTKQICSALAGIGDEIRGFCEDFTSRDLKDWGLVHALNIMVERMRDRTGNEIAMISNGTVSELPFDVALHIYRIAQESLNNAIKHANSTQIKLTLQQSHQELLLQIEDNGVGFDFPAGNRTEERSGLGLGVLKERSDLLTAMGYPALLSVSSSPGSGSTMTLRVDTTA